MLYTRVGPHTRDLELHPSGLGRVPSELRECRTTGSVCGFCSTGCELSIHTRDGRAQGLTPSPTWPVNRGVACPKGWEALAVTQSAARATTPLLRDDGGVHRPIAWDRAMRLFADRFGAIARRHGPESVAFLSTGQIPSEEMLMLGVLAKCGMGMVHGDGNTRQCMATAVTAYKGSFGFDAPPYTYADFEQSDLIVLVGSNLCIAHPILWSRVVANRRDPAIVTLDPRMSETARASTLHLRLRPGSDLALFHGVARALIERGAVDQAFVDASTVGFESFARFVQAYDLPRVASATDLEVAQIEQFIELIAERGRASFWWTMGINQSHQGTRTAQAIINVALMTGNIGRPGTGANSITGQCNAMGSRLFSNTTALPGGYRYDDPKGRATVSRALSIDAGRFQTEPGHAYDRIVRGITQGEIKGLWIIATNPGHSWIDRRTIENALGMLDFVVVQDLFADTETARRADLVLPAAGWGEKDGTFINSERRLGRIRKVQRASGQALADFHIFRLAAAATGNGALFDTWTSPEHVFHKLKATTAGQPCDITGIEDYAMLDRHGGIQWPLPAGHPVEDQHRRLFEDGVFHHEDGRARFVFEPPRPLPETISARFPLLLNTGRGTSAQWHTTTRTQNSTVLARLHPPQAYVELHPSDAKHRCIADGDRVRVVSRRGKIHARAHVTRSVRIGEAFMAMHYATTNLVTRAQFDPHSRQPAYKACAIEIQRLE
ncbi:MAG: nitrate reductase [Myxococcota bacterium]